MSLSKARSDLWMMRGAMGLGVNSSPFWFHGSQYQSVRDQLTFREWKAKHLVAYQSVLLDRYFYEGWKLMAIAAGAKVPLENKWPTLTRRMAELVLKQGGNVAVKCGPQNGGLLAVDIDDTDEIPRFWQQFDTLTQRTGRGFTLFFVVRKDPSPGVWKELHKLPQDTYRYAGGLGAYVLVPLSIHPNGKIYDFLDYRKPISDFAAVTAKVPQRELEN